MCSVLNVHMISQQFSDVVVLEEKLTTCIQCTRIFCTIFLLDHCMGYPIHGIFYKLFLVMKMIEMWILLSSFQYGHITFSTLHQHIMIYLQMDYSRPDSRRHIWVKRYVMLDQSGITIKIFCPISAGSLLTQILDPHLLFDVNIHTLLP